MSFLHGVLSGVKDDDSVKKYDDKNNDINNVLEKLNDSVGKGRQAFGNAVTQVSEWLEKHGAQVEGKMKNVTTPINDIVQQIARDKTSIEREKIDPLTDQIQLWIGRAQQYIGKAQSAEGALSKIDRQLSGKLKCNVSLVVQALKKFQDEAANEDLKDLYMLLRYNWNELKQQVTAKTEQRSNELQGYLKRQIGNLHRQLENLRLNQFTKLGVSLSNDLHFALETVQSGIRGLDVRYKEEIVPELGRILSDAYVLQEFVAREKRKLKGQVETLTSQIDLLKNVKTHVTPPSGDLKHYQSSHGDYDAWNLKTHINQLKTQILCEVKNHVGAMLEQIQEHVEKIKKQIGDKEKAPGIYYNWDKLKTDITSLLLGIYGEDTDGAKNNKGLKQIVQGAKQYANLFSGQENAGYKFGNIVHNWILDILREDTIITWLDQWFKWNNMHTLRSTTLKGTKLEKIPNGNNDVLRSVIMSAITSELSGIIGEAGDMVRQGIEKNKGGTIEGYIEAVMAGIHDFVSKFWQTIDKKGGDMLSKIEEMLGIKDKKSKITGYNDQHLLNTVQAALVSLYSRARQTWDALNSFALQYSKIGNVNDAIKKLEQIAEKLINDESQYGNQITQALSTVHGKIGKLHTNLEKAIKEAKPDNVLRSDLGPIAEQVKAISTKVYGDEVNNKLKELLKEACNRGINELQKKVNGIVGDEIQAANDTLEGIKKELTLLQTKKESDVPEGVDGGESLLQKQANALHQKIQDFLKTKVGQTGGKSENSVYKDLSELQKNITTLGEKVADVKQKVTAVGDELARCILQTEKLLDEAPRMANAIMFRLRDDVNEEIRKAVREVLRKAKKLYTERKKTEVNALEAIVKTQFAEIQKTIKHDGENGVKGLLKTVHGNSFSRHLDGNYSFGSSTELLDDLKEDEIKNDFIKLTGKFKAYAENILIYIGNQINDAFKEPIKKAYYDSLQSIYDQLSNLLEHLGKGDRKFHFDSEFSKLLAELESLLEKFTSTQFGATACPILDAIKGGLTMFSEQLGKAYINKYSGTNDITWEDKKELTKDGKNGAKVCITALFILQRELLHLRKNCIDRWSGRKINSYNNNPLGEIFTRLGYQVSDHESKQNGELRTSLDMQGSDVVTKLAHLIDGTNSNEHLPMCSSNEKQNKFHVMDILTCLVKHVNQYYNACHLNTPQLPKYPCSVFDMSSWLCGLRYNVLNDKIIGQCRTLLNTEKDAAIRHILSAVIELHLPAIFTPIYDFLVTVAGYGDASTYYACEYLSNTLGLHYPSNANSCFDMLLDILRKLYPVLTFLLTQCRLGKSHFGWNECKFGNGVQTSDWQCGPEGDQLPSSKVDCSISSPLHSYLTDGLRGMLPHAVTSSNSKPVCSTCGKGASKMPCLTPLGFRSFTGSKRAGNDLCNVLGKLCGSGGVMTALYSSLTCVTFRPPSTLPDILSFYCQFTQSWDLMPTDHKTNHPIQCIIYDKILATVACDAGDARDLLSPCRLLYHSSSHSEHNTRDNEPDIMYLLGCSNGGCGNYLKPLNYAAYSDFSQKHAEKYLSCLVYVCPQLVDLLARLIDAFASVSCHDYGCSGCNKSSKCSPGKHATDECLENFLGYHDGNYTGEGIVYSDLDRLCDGVMSFLHGVLESVKDDESVTTYDKDISGDRINKVVSDLHDSVGKGRQAFRDAVSQVDTLTKNVTSELGGQYYEEIKGRQGLKLQDQMDGWRAVLGYIAGDIHKIETQNINMLDDTLASQIAHKIEPIQKSVEVLLRAANDDDLKGQAQFVDEQLEEQQNIICEAVSTGCEAFQQTLKNEFESILDETHRLSECKREHFAVTRNVLKEAQNMVEGYIGKFDEEYKNEIFHAFTNIKGQLDVVDPRNDKVGGDSIKSKLRRDTEAIHGAIHEIDQRLGGYVRVLGEWMYKTKKLVEGAQTDVKKILDEVDNPNERKNETGITKAAEQIKVETERFNRQFTQLMERYVKVSETLNGTGGSAHQGVLTQLGALQSKVALPIAVETFKQSGPNGWDLSRDIDGLTAAITGNVQKYVKTNILQKIKAQLKTINGTEESARQNNGLKQVTDKVQKYVKAFAEEGDKFAGVVQGWIDDILKNNGVVKYWLKKYVETNIDRIGNQYKAHGAINDAFRKQIADKIKSALSAHVVLAQDKISTVTDKLEEKVNNIKDGIDMFASGLSESLDNNKVGVVSALIVKAIEEGTELGITKTSPSSDKFYLEGTLQATLTALVSKARQASKELASFTGISDSPTINIVSNVKSALATATTLEQKLENATLPSPSSLSGPGYEIAVQIEGISTKVADPIAVDTPLNDLLQATAKKTIEKLQTALNDSAVSQLNSLNNNVEALETEAKAANAQLIDQAGLVTKNLDALCREIRDAGKNLKMHFEYLRETNIDGTQPNQLNGFKSKLTILQEKNIKSLSDGVRNALELIKDLDKVPDDVEEKRGEVDELMAQLKAKLKAFQSKLNELVDIVNNAHTYLTLAIDAVNNVVRGALNAAKQAVSQLETNLLVNVKGTFHILTKQMQKLFANSHKADLQALQSLVETQKSEITNIIRHDSENGLKGFLKKVRMCLTVMVPQHSVKDYADLLKQIFDKLFDYIKQQITSHIKSQASDTAAGANRNGRLPSNSTPQSNQVSSLHSTLDKLLQFLKDSNHFDPLFQNNLDYVKEALSVLRNLNFSGFNNSVLLDAINGAVKSLVGEFDKAYINAYEGHRDHIDFDKLLETKTVDTVGKSDLQSQTTELTIAGRQLSKIFLTSLTMLQENLSHLKTKCGDTSRYSWKDKKISLKNSDDDNPLGTFLNGCGYEVAKNKASKEGELKLPMNDFTGKDIHEKLDAEIQTTDTLKHIQECVIETVKKTQPSKKQCNVMDIIDCLVKHLGEYYNVCHTTHIPKPKSPCSIFDMLCWMSGLPHNAVFKKLTTHCIAYDTKDDTYLKSHMRNAVAYSLPKLCTYSHKLLSTILGTGDEYTIYASDHCTNSLSLTYPAVPSQCLELLLYILRRLYPVLQFLRMQCLMSDEHAGWASCQYGRDIPTTKSQCNKQLSGQPNSKPKCQANDQPNCQANSQANSKPNCQPTSPLMSYLNDCLPGHLPHHLSSIGCKSVCSNCPKGQPGMPCLTPLGFRAFSGSTKTGSDLCKIIAIIFDDINLSSMYCLAPRPPTTLAEHFYFTTSLVKSLNAEKPQKGADIKTFESVFTSSITERSIQQFDRPSQLTDAFRNAYGLAATDHSNCKHPHLLNLTRGGLCKSGENKIDCAPYLRSMCTDAYNYLADMHSNLYLSWAIYLPWDFWLYLQNLYDAFTHIFCQDWGCISCLHGDTCRKGQHGLTDEKSKAPHCHCSSIVKHGNNDGLTNLANALKKLIGDAISKATTSLQHKSGKLSCSPNPHDPLSYCSQLDGLIKSKNEELNEAKNSNKTSEISSLESKIKQLQSNKDDCTKSHYMDDQRLSSLEGEVRHGIDVIVKLTQFSGSEKSIETLINKEIDRLNKQHNTCENPPQSHPSSDCPQHKLLEELKEKLETLKKNKDNSPHDLLNNLCTGLENFLGYHDGNYTGEGIVYSDLDRLCDGVMSFLHGVLESVKDDESVTTYDKDISGDRINKVVSDLHDSVGKGREAFGNAVTQVEGKTGEVTTELGELITKLSSGAGGENVYYKMVEGKASKPLQEQLEWWSKMLTCILTDINNIDINHVNILDSALRDKIKNETRSIKTAVRMLRESAVQQEFREQVKHADRELEERETQVKRSIHIESENVRDTLYKEFFKIRESVTALEKAKRIGFHNIYKRFDAAQDFVNEFDKKYKTGVESLFDYIKTALEDVDPKNDKGGALNNESKLRQDVLKFRRNLGDLNDDLKGCVNNLENWTAQAKQFVDEAIGKAMDIKRLETGKEHQEALAAIPTQIRSNATGLHGHFAAKKGQFNAAVEAINGASAKLETLYAEVEEQVTDTLTVFQGRGYLNVEANITELKTQLKKGMKQYVEELLLKKIQAAVEQIKGKVGEKGTKDQDNSIYHNWVKMKHEIRRIAEEIYTEGITKTGKLGEIVEGVKGIQIADDVVKSVTSKGGISSDGSYNQNLKYIQTLLSEVAKRADPIKTETIAGQIEKELWESSIPGETDYTPYKSYLRGCIRYTMLALAAIASQAGGELIKECKFENVKDAIQKVGEIKDQITSVTGANIDKALEQVKQEIEELVQNLDTEAPHSSSPGPHNTFGKTVDSNIAEKVNAAEVDNQLAKLLKDTAHKGIEALQTPIISQVIPTLKHVDKEVDKHVIDASRAQSALEHQAQEVETHLKKLTEVFSKTGEDIMYLLDLLKKERIDNRLFTGIKEKIGNLQKENFPGVIKDITSVVAQIDKLQDAATFVDTHKKEAGKLMNDLKNDIQNHISLTREAVAKADTNFDNVMRMLRKIINEADKICNQAVSQLQKRLLDTTEEAFQTVRLAVRLFFARQKMADLIALKYLLERRLRKMRDIIDDDFINGVKGLMGKMHEILPTLDAVEKQRTFGDMAERLGWYLSPLLSYTAEQVKTPGKAKKGEKEDSEGSKKVQDIKSAVDKLLSHLSKSDKLYNFDYEFQLKLSALTDAVNALSAEKFAGHQNPELLDALKKGMLGVTGELKHAYVNRYDSQKFTENLVDAKYELTPSNNTTIITLRDYGRKCSKVFLTILNIAQDALSRLHYKCNGDWKNKKLCKIENNDENPLGKFLHDCGYGVAKNESSKDGELHHESVWTGNKIHTDCVKAVQDATNNEHLKACVSKQDQLDVLDILKCLMTHLNQYNQVGHIATFTATSTPCSIFDMLCWLSGLPHNAVFQKLTAHCNAYDTKGDTDLRKRLLDAVAYSFPNIGKYSHNMLTTIVGTGNADTIYGSDLANNSLKFKYPSSGEECIHTLLDILRRLLPVCRFLYKQCGVRPSHFGWRDCQYGKNIPTAKWPCTDHSTDKANSQPTTKPTCQANDKPNSQPNCQPTSPLMSYLNDCLPGHLPHQLMSVGCKSVCSTCPSTSRNGMPCLTPLGFRAFSGSTKTGKDLCEIIKKFFANVNLSSIFCLGPKPPVSLPEHFGFALSLVGQWADGSRYGVGSLQTAIESTIKDKSIALYDQPADLTNALTNAYGHGIEGHDECDDTHVTSLTSSGTCNSKNTHSAPYLSPLCSDAYKYLANKNAGLYLSWIAYLPWAFHQYLECLLDAFKNIFCHEWGCHVKHGNGGEGKGLEELAEALKRLIGDAISKATSSLENRKNELNCPDKTSIEHYNKHCSDLKQKIDEAKASGNDSEKSKMESDLKKHYNGVHYLTEDARKGALGDIEERQKTLEKLKENLEAFIGKENDDAGKCQNLLTNLSEGLEKFLGFNSESKGYSGEGIVYSDLDRLCDGVMAFLHGVLSNIQPKLGQHKTQTDSAINSLKSTNNNGITKYKAAIAAVEEWVRRYNNEVAESNRKVAVKRYEQKTLDVEFSETALSTAVKVEHAEKSINAKLQECQEHAKKFTSALDITVTDNPLNNAINDLNAKLKDKLESVRKTVEYESGRLGRVKVQEEKVLEERKAEIKRVLEAMKCSVDKSVGEDITRILAELKRRVEEILEALKQSCKHGWRAPKDINDIKNTDLKRIYNEMNDSVTGKKRDIEDDAAKLVKWKEQLDTYINVTVKPQIAQLVETATQAVKQIDAEIKKDLGRMEKSITEGLKPIVEKSGTFCKNFRRLEVRCSGRFKEYMKIY
ncbi:hypothetical protein, conserved [Babesia ovata]|uniref:Extracellular matrix-binding ebh n=1 Tax=Babesia ovata TaxID=189622 RepID=A0A2H6KJ51_9APIC|nr:uncharacterized protein BOVATA_045140 [Babesia ovata]GBE63022.1 hypothetical protein, conserved [Babesia ovata]